MAPAIRIRREVLHRLCGEAAKNPALECCGLLTGREGIVTDLLPAENALASPTAYEIEPKELFRLFKAMRASGLEHLGIYHSHPAGPPVPSASDVELAYYPEAAYFILVPQTGADASVRAFRLGNSAFEEIAIEPV